MNKDGVQLIDEGVDPTDNDLTDDEQCALYHEQQAWADVNNEWVKAGKKCGCGQPITLEDAFYFGCCDECRRQEVPF